jgi:hypothetical protein
MICTNDVVPAGDIARHGHTLTPEGRCHPPVTIEAVLEANALDQIAQFALNRLTVAFGKIPVIGRARQACQLTQPLHIGLGSIADKIADEALAAPPLVKPGLPLQRIKGHPP